MGVFDGAVQSTFTVRSGEERKRKSPCGTHNKRGVLKKTIAHDLNGAPRHRSKRVVGTG